MKHDRILIGTYHKTGTVWMRRVFRQTAKALGIEFQDNVRDPEFKEPDTGIYFDDHCYFPEKLAAATPRGFRMVRDPRDVVISGAHYHVKSEEPWLHIPQDRFDGRTYQETIGAFESADERYEFEMHHAGNHTLKCMFEDFDKLPNVIVVHYENMVTDNELKHFRRLCQELGFDSAEQKVADKYFLKNSLFSNKKLKSGHIRSGKSAQWRGIFSRALAEKFVENHGDVLIRLGYEPNHDWVLDLRS